MRILCAPVWCTDAVYLGSLVPWITGTLDHWYLGSLVPWITGTMDHWYLGSLVPWITGSLDHWYLGSLRVHHAAQTPRFRVPRVKRVPDSLGPGAGWW